ncbi:MAG: tetratricopeptide repeat protein [Lachnospiraceae bacterium]
MGKVYACVGRYAGTPYTIKRAWIHVSCVEELCFYICNNAYLLEKDFFSADLLEWLEEECNLVDLSRKLKGMLKQGAKLDALVKTLLSDIQYCRDTEIEEVQKLLLSNDSISTIQKSKIRADYFLKNQKYALAQKLYEDIKEKLTRPAVINTQDKAILPYVYHNLGVIYANLFHYEQAAEYFQKAYELDGRPEHQMAYLAACRISMKDDEYLKHLSTLSQDAYQISGELEESLRTILEDWNRSEEKMKAGGIAHMYENHEQEEFALAILQQTEKLKDEYRSRMGD